MRPLAALALLILAAAPAQAQWTAVPVAEAPTTDRLHGGPGFLLRYPGFESTAATSCTLTISRDGGLTFATTGYRVPVQPGTNYCPGAELYFDTAPTGEVLAYLLDPAGVPGVFRTADGVAWTRLAGMPAGEGRTYPRVVGADVVAHAVTTSASGRVVRLAAGAAAWTDVPPVPFSGTQLPNLPAVMGSVARPDGGRRVYARSLRNNARVVYTSDDLQTWTAVPDTDSLGTRYLHDFGDGVATIEASPVRLRTATVGGQFRILRYAQKRTTTGGAVWRDGFAYASQTGQAAGGERFVRVDSQTAFAFTKATAYEVWLTRDRAATWTLVDSRASPLDETFDRFFQTDGRYLFYINKDTRELWRRPLADFGITVAGEAGPAPAGLTLSIGPNPSRDAATLRFALDAAQPVRVSVTDALGRDVLALERPLGAGPQALALDVSGLAPGVYVARVVAGAASASVRLTIAR